VISIPLGSCAIARPFSIEENHFVNVLLARSGCYAQLSTLAEVKSLAVATVALAFLGACSGGPDTYDGVGELVTALRDGDVECTNLHIGGGGELVDESGSCAFEMRSLAIFVFSEESTRDEWLRIGGTFGIEVVGPNWVVIAQDDAGAQRVVDAIGGEVGTE
jgi:hypothetical protein